MWFLLGDATEGVQQHCRVIEMQDYLIVVDANYPSRARELIAEVEDCFRRSRCVMYLTRMPTATTPMGILLWTAAMEPLRLRITKMIGEMDRVRAGTLAGGGRESARMCARPAPGQCAATAEDVSQRTRLC